MDIDKVMKEHQKKFFTYAGYKENHEFLRQKLEEQSLRHKEEIA